MVSMDDVVAGRERWHVAHADCLFALSCLPDASVDAIVSDVPYGLGPREPRLPEILAYLGGEELDTGGDFMAKRWTVPSVGVWQECFRILKPGGHVLSFGGTRTFDLIGLGLRAAGFQFRDTIGAEGVLRWVQAQGFPKGLDLAKAIDALLGVEPTVVGTRVLTGSAALSTAEKGGTYAAGTHSAGRTKEVPITVPTSPEAKAWDGWDVALKPSWEPILVFRKPLEGNVAENILAHGTGALNIDGCRVGSEPLDPSTGRWPPNGVLCHLPSCRRNGTRLVSGDDRGDPDGRRGNDFADVGAPSGDPRPNGHVYGDAEVPAYDCAQGCPVATLDAQSGERPSTLTGRADPNGQHAHPSSVEHCESMFGVGGARANVYADSGGASRFFPRFEWNPTLDVPFFYVAKATTAERTAGLDDRSEHPTMKPVALMQWLVRLVTPPGGLVIDPYVGSGSTGVAAMIEPGHFRFIGIEREPEYVAIAEQRIKHVAGGAWKTPAENAAEAEATGKRKQLALF